MGAFVLGAELVRMGNAQAVWQFLRACGGRQFRVVYACQDGRVRDMIGRQGVYDSRQDGTVQGIGRAMTCERALTLSFHTTTHGAKVNTGTGKGYRTLRAAGILAIRIDGVDVLTDAGVIALAKQLELTK
jgi:hypothetical protein